MCLFFVGVVFSGVYLKLQCIMLICWVSVLSADDDEEDAVRDWGWWFGMLICALNLCMLQFIIILIII